MLSYGMNLGSTMAGQTSRVTSAPATNGKTFSDDGGASVIMQMIKDNSILAIMKGQEQVKFVQAAEVDQVACQAFWGQRWNGTALPFPTV